MNPQLERHLQEFDLLDSVYSENEQHGQEEGHNNNNNVKSGDVKAVNTSTLNCYTSTEDIGNEEDQPGSEEKCSEQKIMINPSSVGISHLVAIVFYYYLQISLLLIVIAIAEWKQLFTLQVETSLFGDKKVVPVSSGTAFVGMAIVFAWTKWIIGSDEERRMDLRENRYLVSPQEVEEWEKQRHAGRLKISKLLGSIGAPFLLQDTCSMTTIRDKNSNFDDDDDDDHDHKSTPQNTIHNFGQAVVADSSDWLALVVDFTHSHVKLIQTLDTSMDIIKMGTALQLGSTENTAERVERALFGRRSRESKSAAISAEKKSVVSFANIRGLVSEAMLHQANTLESLLFLAELTSNNGETDSLNEEKRDAKESLISAMKNAGSSTLGGLPPVVTITWLRSSRQQLCELLSHVLDNLSAADFGGGSVEDAKLKCTLAKSMRMADELRHHINSSLGIVKESNWKGGHESSGQEALPSELSSLSQRVTQMKTQLRNYYVALWAMGDALQQASREDMDHGINVHRWTEWRDRLIASSETLYTSLQDVDRDFFQDQANTTYDENEEPLPGVPSKSQKELLSEHSYTAETQLQCEQPKRALQKPIKTAIFSGKGALEPSLPRTRTPPGPLSSNNCQQPSTVVLQPDPVAQHVLLSELRTRLQTLSLPEEEHETADLGYDDKLNKSNHSIEKTTAIPLFLGATGSVLVGELQNTLKLMGNQTSESDDEDSVNDAN